MIADDHPIVREGLKRIVAACPDMRIAGEAADGHEVLAQVGAVPVDVILLDVSMPGISFLDTLRRLRLEHPEAYVLVLSIHPEDHYALRALRAGAAGYLTKDHSPDELAAAIRMVYEGKRYISPSLAQRLAAELGPEPGLAPHRALSDREYEVFCRLSDGKGIKDIAAELSLSPKTVSTYRTRVLAKMRLKNNVELIRYALQNRVVD